MKGKEVLKIINALRESDFYIECIFTQGSCYRFFLFLKTVFPQSMPYLHKNRDHIATRIGGNLYDINGLLDFSDFEPLKNEDLEMVENWSFRGKMLLQLDECPNCEEPLIFEPKK